MADKITLEMTKLRLRHVFDDRGDLSIVWHDDEPRVRGIGPTEGEALTSLESRLTNHQMFGDVKSATLGRLHVTWLKSEPSAIGYGLTTQSSVADLLNSTNPEYTYEYSSNLFVWIVRKDDLSCAKASLKEAVLGLKATEAALKEPLDSEIWSRVGRFLGHCQWTGVHEIVQIWNTLLERQLEDTKLLTKAHNQLKCTYGVELPDTIKLITELQDTIKRRRG